MQKIADSSDTNNVNTFMKIYDSQEQIKLTVLYDFLSYKKLKIIVTFRNNVRFGGGGEVAKTRQIYLHN